MNNNKVFIPHELKTIEVDVEKRIFRVNGEDFGKECTGFSINGSPEDVDKWFNITMRISSDIKFANYDFDGNKTGESEKTYEVTE